MKDTRIAVVEDETETRKSLTVLFGGAPGFRCVGAHANGKTALCDLPHERPHIVLIDLELPDMPGVDVIQKIKKTMPEVRVVVYSKHATPDYVFATLRAGADAYLDKDVATYADLIEALQEVQGGGAPMSATVARLVLRFFREQNRPNARLALLTKREWTVLEVLAGGYANKEIAAELDISVATVRSHVRSILEKLHARSRTEAAKIFHDAQIKSDLPRALKGKK